MDNPEKLATPGTQEEEKRNTICVGHYYAPVSTNNKHEPSYQQREVKMNRTFCLRGNRNRTYQEKKITSCFTLLVIKEYALYL